MVTSPRSHQDLFKSKLVSLPHLAAHAAETDVPWEVHVLFLRRSHCSKRPWLSV